MTLGETIRVVQTPTFKQAVEKLKPDQKKELDIAMKTLVFLRVYKFKMNIQLTLLGYAF